LSKINWTNERRKLKDLKPWERNPRQITKDQAKRLVESFNEFGQVETIAIGPNNEVYNGHQRLNVLKDKYGDEYEVEVRVSSQELTEKQREKLTVYLHKGAAGVWDFDTLANEFELDDLLEWGFDKHELDLDLWASEAPEDVEPQIDKAEELREKWGVETGQLWQLGEHKLICGDCTDKAVVDRMMGGEKARMIFTDPPWNVAIGKDSNPRHRQRDGLENDDMSEEDFSAFISSFVSSFILANDGDLYCVLGAAEWPTLDRNLRDAGYHWSATIIWVKDLFVLGRSKYHRRYEPIWYGWHTANKSSFGDARNLDDVWEIPRPRVSKEHPTMKPVELVEKAVTNSSQLEDAVFDPFLGSGTTLIACERLGRKCRAVEISPAYVRGCHSAMGGCYRKRAGVD